MKNILRCFVVFALIVLQGCGEKRDESVMEKIFSSLQECLYAMKQVSHGPLDIVIDTPETVSGYLANKENFGCQRKVTGTQGVSYYGYYFQTEKEVTPEARKPLGSNTKKEEPTKATDSSINMNNLATRGYTSIGLTKADLAWHAINTYGFDCTEVTEKSEAKSDGSFLITCSSGIKLTVYLRDGQHPLINESHKTESGDIATTYKQEIILPEVAQKNVGKSKTNASSVLTEDEAIQSFMSEMKEKQYHDLPIECLLPKNSGYKNVGYTIELFNTCGKNSPSLISRWRIDANSSKLYRQNEKGKYVSPSYVERANILRVNTAHPYHWLKVLLLEKIPALHKWSSDISKNSKGKVQLSVELDAPPDPESNNEYDVNYYHLRLGEAHEDHFTAWDWILVHRFTKEIMIEDISQGASTYIPLSSWGRLK